MKTEVKFEVTCDNVEQRNIARIVRGLFGGGNDLTGGEWRNYSIPVARITEVVRLLQNYPHTEANVRLILTRLVRAKFLRSRVHNGVRFYEAVLS
jgi:hypothetical protein